MNSLKQIDLTTALSWKKWKKHPSQIWQQWNQKIQNKVIKIHHLRWLNLNCHLQATKVASWSIAHYSLLSAGCIASPCIKRREMQYTSSLCAWNKLSDLQDHAANLNELRLCLEKRLFFFVNICTSKKSVLVFSLPSSPTDNCSIDSLEQLLESLSDVEALLSQDSTTTPDSPIMEMRQTVLSDIS